MSGLDEPERDAASVRRVDRRAERRLDRRVVRTAPEPVRPCFVAFTWALSSRGDVLPRAAGTFTTVEEARQFLGRVRRAWLDDDEGWAVFKLPAESGRGALVASGVVRDLTARSYWVGEPDHI